MEVVWHYDLTSDRKKPALPSWADRKGRRALLGSLDDITRKRRSPYAFKMVLTPNDITINM